jgi:hypothetical protein
VSIDEIRDVRRERCDELEPLAGARVLKRNARVMERVTGKDEMS